MTHTRVPEPISDPLMILAQRWRVTVALGILGALVGLLIGFQRDTVYTAEARMAVGSSDLTSYQVAGYAAGAAVLASNYARYVNGTPATAEVLAQALGPEAESIISVAASPIPDSNVVRIEVSGTDADAAVEAADALTADVKRQAEGLVGRADELRRRHEELSAAVIEQSQVLRNYEGPAVTPIRARLDNLIMQRDAVGAAYQQALTANTAPSELKVIQPAAVTHNDRSRKLQLYTVGGALLGLVCALVLTNVMGPRRGNDPEAPSAMSP